MDRNYIIKARASGHQAKLIIKEISKDAVVQELKRQLAEKDKEIENLKEMCDFLKENKICTVNFKDRTETHLFPKSEENIIRHQVCEEIRKKLKKCLTPACGTYIVYYEAKNVEDALDQIEKGESK